MTNPKPKALYAPNTSTLMLGNTGNHPVNPESRRLGSSLKDVYLHVPIHQDFVHFLALDTKGMNLSSMCSPGCFPVNVASDVHKDSWATFGFLGTQGFAIFAYLDDWFILGKSEQNCWIQWSN